MTLDQLSDRIIYFGVAVFVVLLAIVVIAWMVAVAFNAMDIPLARLERRLKQMTYCVVACALIWGCLGVAVGAAFFVRFALEKMI